MKMHYDARNNHIYCSDAYKVKETLKNLGFRYCSIDQTWFITCPKDLAILGNLICDVAVDCKMSYFDLCDFLSSSLPTEYAETMMHMDEAHIAKLQQAYAG